MNLSLMINFDADGGTKQTASLTSIPPKLMLIWNSNRNRQYTSNTKSIENHFIRLVYFTILMWMVQLCMNYSANDRRKCVRLTIINDGLSCNYKYALIITCEMVQCTMQSVKYTQNTLLVVNYHRSFQMIITNPQKNTNHKISQYYFTCLHVNWLLVGKSHGFRRLFS